MCRARQGLLIVLACACAACEKEQAAYRGTGHNVAPLSVADRAAVYRAALGGAFTLNDPTLWILADPVALPRSSGLAGGDTLPADLMATLRSSGLVKGTCQVPVKNTRIPLICRAERGGYVVRFSDPFTVSGDTVQVHMVVQQYAIPTDRPAERLRFERAYYVVHDGARWRAVREARLRQP
jgi:hypothetical protein